MKNKLTLAGCVILDNEGKILLLHRNTPQRKQWETPGGKIEDGEEPSKAAEREIEEELGVDVEIIKLLGTKDFVEDEYMMTYNWFLAKVVSGIPRAVETEKFDDLGYFFWEELNQMKDQLSPNTHNLVEAYFSNLINID